MVMRLAKSGIRFLSTAATKASRDGNEKQAAVGSQCRTNSWMRQYLINLGQQRHEVRTQLEREWDGLPPAEAITPLSEDEAVQGALTFVKRGLIFTGWVAALVAFGAYFYRLLKEIKAKEEKLRILDNKLLILKNPWARSEDL